MKKNYWEKLVENEGVLKLADLDNLQENKEFYFKLIRDISLPEEEFQYPEVRQKNMQLIRVIEELIKSTNAKMKLLDLGSTENIEKIHADMEKYILESEKNLKEYEELIYFKWGKSWEEELIRK